MRLGWPFDDEIGKHLRLEALAADPGAHAFASQPDFDEKLFRMEMERDARAAPGARIVETWHPGNIAYAEARNPATVRAWWGSLRERTCQPGVLVQPLAIDRSTAISRCTEPGPDDLVDGLLRVATRIVSIAGEWGLPLLPEIRTDRCTPEEAMDRIVAVLLERGYAARGASDGQARRLATPLGPSMQGTGRAV
jgi:hypothetical protein